MELFSLRPSRYKDTLATWRKCASTSVCLPRSQLARPGAPALFCSDLSSSSRLPRFGIHPLGILQAHILTSQRPRRGTGWCQASLAGGGVGKATRTEP